MGTLLATCGAGRSSRRITGLPVAFPEVTLTTVVRKLVSGNTLGHGAAIVAGASLAVYTGSFAIGLGPVFWLLLSEL